MVIKTRGDIMQDVSLSRIGGKGIFVKEIEEALLHGEIDLAIHSMKDVPVELPEGLEIFLTPKREDPLDALISRDGLSIEALPEGARIGTGSLRRGIQIANRFERICVTSIRGNLDTRIRKVDDGLLEGVIVAAAGMRRMGWAERITQPLTADLMLPAPCQGILGIENRKGDPLALSLQFLRDEQTWREMTAERAFLSRLGGGCQLPVAALARVADRGIQITALIGSLDGKTIIRRSIAGPLEEAARLGDALARNLLDAGGRDILDDVYQSAQ